MTPRGSEPPIFAMRRRRRRRQWWGLGLLVLICAGAAYGWYARSILTQPAVGPYSPEAGLASDWQPEAPIPSAGPESAPESEIDGVSESEPATAEAEPVGGESESAVVAGVASGTKPKAGAGAKRPGTTHGAASGARAPGGKAPRGTAGAGGTSAVTPSEPPPVGVDTKTWEKDGSVMVRVPGGNFQMGAKSDEAAEGPPHSVTLPTFWIDRTEVTNKQYKRFVDATNRPVPYVAEAWAAPRNWDRAARAYPEGQGDMPVVLVSWDDAAAYARWAGKRLPTEAEWEYAARGSKASAYPWGGEWDSARCNSLASDPFDETPAPVGSFPRGASWCGTLDMAGNVWEWVADWFAADYYAASPASSPAGPATGRYRCMRGGSWGSPSELCRSYSRGFRPPYARSDAAGFRCAADG